MPGVLILSGIARACPYCGADLIFRGGRKCLRCLGLCRLEKGQGACEYTVAPYLPEPEPQEDSSGLALLQLVDQAVERLERLIAQAHKLTSKPAQPQPGPQPKRKPGGGFSV
jgi:hypothetical protein